MSNARGLFVVFEGIDASGKSSQSRMLYEHLRKKGYKAILTKEPTDGAMGKLLKKALGGKIKLDPRALALLFAADRIEHVKKTIEPAINRGTVVISDRYYYSSLAYQGLENPEAWLRAINKFAAKPDMIFYIDVTPEESIRRINSDNHRKKKELFEREALQEKVRSRYLALVRKENMILINGMRNAKEVHREIARLVEKRI